MDGSVKSGEMNTGGSSGGGGRVCLVGGSRNLSDALKSKYKRFCDPPPPPQPGNRRRYECLTPLKVYGNREVQDEPPPIPSICPRIITEKIKNALMLMSFREQHLLVQFWSPIAVGKRCLLTTFDQPFGLGVVDEGLYLYRSKSEQRVLVVDREDSDELAPPARVYCQKLPEWSLDVHGLLTRQRVQDYAACFNIRGYINLPVIEPTSGSCVGILELITSSSYVDFAFEVREVSRALKEENLKSPNVFEDTRLYIGDERKQSEVDEISAALKMICEVQKLPLAQTWALAGCSSVVANSGNLEKSCSSFNKKCIGKVCMSTADLPFCVRDMSMWSFYEACRERHIDTSQGVVGRSLSAHGLCFCGDVSNLSEDDYPLAPYARMSGITGSLAVCLKSLETDAKYVIELFLPPDSENGSDSQSVVKSLLKTVRQQLIKNTFRVHLGIMSSPEVIGGIPLQWNSQSPSSTEKRKSHPESGDERRLVENEPNDVDVPFSENQNEVAHIEHVEKDNLIIQLSQSAAAVTRGSVDPCLELGTEDFYNNPGKTIRKYDDNSDKLWRKRKRTEMPISLVELSKHYGMTMEDAAVILRVSRSTLKRICRSYGITKWPFKNVSDRNVSPVHVPEEFHASTFGASVEQLDTNDTTFDRVTLNKHSRLGSTLVPHQPEQTNLPNNSAQPHTTIREKYTKNVETNTVENLMIKANYRKDAPKSQFNLLDRLAKLEELVAATITEQHVENVAPIPANTGGNLMIKVAYRKDTLKFQFNLSDGLVKLLELVAARFQLELGSFGLKYVDEDGDLILITCDSDLMDSLSAFEQPNIQTLIRLLVCLVVPQSSDASPLSSLPDSSAGSNIAVNTVENVMIKAAYRDNTLKFQFNLSDGLVNLEELVAARFQLQPGSFRLNYVDEDDNMMSILCDKDLMESLSAFEQPNIQTLIRLLVCLVVPESPDT